MGLGRIIHTLLFGHAPERVAQASLEALNGRDWAGLRKLLTANFYFRDNDDNRIEGPDLFLSAMQSMLLEAPDYHVKVERFERTGNAVLMRGATKSANPRFSANSVWRMDIVGGKVACLQNYRANDTLRLFEYAERSEPGQPGDEPA